MNRHRLLLLAALCATSAGCWDFVEPEFAEANAAAIMQVNANIDESGNFSMTGLLVPGLNEDGFQRAVLRDTLYIFGVPITSTSTLPSGSRVYSFNAALGPQALSQPFTIDPPKVEDMSIEPTVRWYSPQTPDPDTIRVARGADLQLHIVLDPNTPIPSPQQQWFLLLSGRAIQFQIGANGPPPAELVIPAEWIPEPADSVVRINFTSFQSAQPLIDKYRGVYSYTVRLDWVIVLQ